ncbi:hypothetical protein AKJ57_00100 [candidate division MSBL1 archaeon SCGC-AAA259A05]|uniref:PRC-barrel domain-containing protein n=1 Tax=candidate division MSBL1 archaeon SCGC-AAA259A05 TaxID=1698259 RepID=A0A133UC25_9EURY|nr:hypothetical protein AKJ57_00100 [candidate division MSBL1 archaeon SCGC-AAA259A05]
MKASDYYGLDMYSDKGYYIGEVQEVMLDLDDGEIAGLVFERRGESNKMVPYGSVMAIGDIIVVKSGRIEKREETEESSGMEEV